MAATISRANPATAHRTPPDYTSRRVKVRLFITLATIMFAAALIERHFNPSPSVAPSPPQPFNNRLHSQPRTTHDPAGTFVSSLDSPPSTLGPATPIQQPFQPVERTLSQGWKEVYAHLDGAARDRLFEILYASAQRQPFPPEKRIAAAELHEQLRTAWDAYQQTATRSLADLAETDKADWLKVLHQADDQFQASIRPLHLLSTHEDPPPSLKSLERTIVPLARQSVLDDTPILRLPEREIWLHDFARLRENSSAVSPAPISVTYLQLSRQPADYRGRFVAIKGTVRRAYHSAAAPNYLDIPDYCVYWLHPAGGPDTPIVVYSLHAPPGFPRLAKSQSEAQTNLREDVVVTGIFFKRCAYAAQTGTYTAPLLLANTVTWQPAAPTINIAPTPTLVYEVGAAALAAFLVALCITSVLWKRSASRRSPSPAPSSANVINLANLPDKPTPIDHLRELEKNSSGGNP